MRTTPKLALGSLLVVTLLAFPASALSVFDSAIVTVPPWETVDCEAFDPDELVEGRGVLTFPVPGEPDMTVTVHVLCVGDDGGIVDTDCTATSYSHTGWKWTTTYYARVDTWNPSGLGSSTVVDRFGRSAQTWENAAGVNIFGSFSSGGSRANIAVRDNVNQHGWKSLSSSTIAVTYTWSSSGRAVESDAAYNTYFSWSASGESNKMDLQNIATHELGHTFGMGHSSSTSSNSCLTMYPSGALGETQKRSLGDGDIIGIRRLY